MALHRQRVELAAASAFQAMSSFHQTSIKPRTLKSAIYDNLALERAQVDAFCHSGECWRGTSDWHACSWPHLLYVEQGLMQVETEERLWLLPPRHAIWIGANVSHRTVCLSPARFHSIFLHPRRASQMAKASENASLAVRVLAVTPLAREMICYAALRWGIERDPQDAVANQFFATLLMLCQQWVDDELALWLPRPRSRSLQQVVDYVLANLEEAQPETAAELIDVSPRTLRRRMQREMQITWRQFVHNARMLRAVTLLAASDCSVSDAARIVGYSSLSSFSKAFARFTGNNPSHYLTVNR